VNTEVTQIGGLDIEVVRKKIKNLHIGCYPPDGRVRVASPEHVGADAIRLAVLTRMPWIKRKQEQFMKQERQTPRRFISGETHFLFGRPLRLDVHLWEKTTYRIVQQGNDKLRMDVTIASDCEQRRKWMDSWLRLELRKLATPRIDYWSARMGVSPQQWGIRLMKTKWGSCNPDKRIIWLNSELAKKSEHMIDYVIVHELAHLVSPKHDDRFTAILDRELPRWRHIRREMNDLPLAAWVD
jgi:predicted metal-dependent hydrolase